MPFFPPLPFFPPGPEPLPLFPPGPDPVPWFPPRPVPGAREGVVVVVEVGGGVVEVGDGSLAPVDGVVTPVTEASPEVAGAEAPTGTEAPRPVRVGGAPLAGRGVATVAFRHDVALEEPNDGPTADPVTRVEQGTVTTWCVDGVAGATAGVGVAGRCRGSETRSADWVAVPDGAAVAGGSSNMWSTMRAAGAGKPVAAANPVLPASTVAAMAVATAARRARR